MSNTVESKNEITFEEFAAWLTGLIRGKAGALPDIDDWKQIKKMMERVRSEKQYIALPQQGLPYHSPEIQYVPAKTQDYQIWWSPYGTSNTIPEPYTPPPEESSNVVQMLSTAINNIT